MYIYLLFWLTEGSAKTFGPVLDWLEPYQDLDKLDYSCAGALSKLFHTYVDQLPKIEMGLVSCLRIMTNIALPDEATSATEEGMCSLPHIFYSAGDYNKMVDFIKRV